MSTLTHEQLLELLHGDPETGMFVWRVKRGRYAVVGLVAGRKHVNGYWQIGINGKQYWAHRLVWFYVHGVWPPYEIDHIDGSPSNNALKNLRLATRSENMQNIRQAHADNKSGLLGVTKVGHRWRAQISINGKRTHLGYFDTPEEAHAAYVKAKRVRHPGCTI